MRHIKRSSRNTQSSLAERITKQSRRIINALQEAGYTTRKQTGKAYWYIDNQSHSLVWLGQSQQWCIVPANEELQTVVDRALSHEKKGAE